MKNNLNLYDGCYQYLSYKMKFKNFSIMTAKLRLLLKLLNEGASQREISRQLDISRTSVKSYMDRFTASGMSNTELQSLDDGALLKISQGEIYRQQPDGRFDVLKPLLEVYSKEVRRPKMTVQKLWEEYVEEFGDLAYSYTTFKHHLQEYISSHTYKYHNEHKPGEILQVDFAGDKLYLTERYTGEKIPVVVLCCVLPCSGFSFVYALPDASIENLFPALARCLSYIGGVPECILSDNMKQWVKRRDKDGPVFTDAALEFGVHYSTRIDATKVRKPTHKASVEATVHYAYERIYTDIRNETFYTIEELNSRIMELLDKFNDRKMKNRDYSRREYFELNEKSTLHDLPETEFTIKYTKDCIVGSNYHIYINTHQYSVPYEYVRKSVSVVYDQFTVEIYNSSYNRIALHKRSFRKYGYTTNKDHMPPNHLAYESEKGNRNAAYYLYRARQIEPSVEEVLRIVLDKAVCVEQCYNSCEAILQLAKHDMESFIQACKYVTDRKMSTANARIIKSIMLNRSYLLPKRDTDEQAQPLHDNLRGKEAFLN